MLKKQATYHQTPVRMISWGKWAPLKLTMLLLPLSSFWVIREEDYTPNDSRTKIRDRTPMSPGDTMKYENGARVAEIYKATIMSTTSPV